MEYLGAELSLTRAYNIYKNTSAYVHLGSMHSEANLNVRMEGEEQKLRMKVGGGDDYSIPKRVDFAYNFYKVTEILFFVLEDYKKQKIANNTNE